MHPGIGAGAPTVDAHFATANHLVKMTLGDAFQFVGQEIIQPLTIMFIADVDHSTGARCDFFGHADILKIV